MEVQAAQIFLDLFVVGIRGYWRLQPFWQSRNGLLSSFGSYLDSFDFISLCGGEGRIGGNEVPE